jgi:ribosomal protein S18 acetylase RimI-like enzyme
VIQKNVQSLNHRERAVAEGIHTVQMAAYAQEARLLGAKHFPPLERTVEDIQASDEAFFGVLEDRQIIGALSVWPDEEPGAMNISSLVVAPHRQHQGIGRLLLTAALEQWRHAVLTVSTAAKNVPALSLYAKFGFKEYRRKSLGAEAGELVKLRRFLSEAGSTATDVPPAAQRSSSH